MKNLLIPLVLVIGFIGMIIVLIQKMSTNNQQQQPILQLQSPEADWKAAALDLLNTGLSIYGKQNN